MVKIAQYPRNADGTAMDLSVGVLTDASGNNGARLTNVPTGPDGAPIDSVGLVLVDAGGNIVDLSNLPSPATPDLTYTIDTLPSAAIAGRRIYVSDGIKSANSRFLGTSAYSDGRNWNRYSDDAVVAHETPQFLFNNGEVGAYYDLDLTKGLLFQDHIGLTPVTAANQNVGMVVPANGATSGVDLYLGAAASVGAGWSWNAGTRVGTATAASSILRLPHVNDGSGGGNPRYVLPALEVVVTSGSLEVYVAVAGGAYRAVITQSGTYTLHLVAGGIADAGTYFNAIGFTGTITYKGTYLENPFTFYQLTAGSRPKYQVDADGYGYIDSTDASVPASKVLTMSGLTGTGHAPFTLPAYMAHIIAKKAPASQDMIYTGGGAVSMGFGNVNDPSAISVGTAKAGDFKAPGCRVGTGPVGLPVPVDLLVTAGVTSSYVANGNRSIPEDPTFNASELRNYPNTILASDNHNGFDVLMTETYWYGGVIRMGASMSDDQRFRVGHWMMCKVGRNKAQVDDYTVIIGQSNAMGVGNYATATAVPLNQGYEYLDDGDLKPFREPMQHCYAGQAAMTGSAWGGFAKRWYDRTGRRMCIVGSAFSGEGLINGAIEPYPTAGWLNGEILTTRMAAKQAAFRADYPLATFRGWVYMGGENDTTLSFTQTEYEGYLTAFLAKLRAKTGIADGKLLICSLDNTPGASAAWGIIRAAQAAVAAANPDIELIVPFQDYVVGQGLSGDTIHLNQTALNDMGYRGGDAAATVWGF